ncbi:MAG: nickel pincer cofactor biosynthesis protein LarC [Dorea sp.]|nr:nickel pincer cofactor biosynthesis protein LarC [Dorea sp.]
MSKTLYLECYSGISGDMTAGALLDLGADEKVLREALKSLPLDEFDIAVKRVKKSGLDACDFHVILDEAHDPHDHDMEYLHGHEHSPAEGGGHIHAQEHHHEHVHRGLPEIRDIIEGSGLSRRAKETALRIFQILAEAEAKAHGMPVEQVHFHEVGAVDSIVDIVAAAVCLDNLDVTEVTVTELYEGRGTIRCQHGIIPVPVPAVVNIVSAHGLSLHMTETEGELVTPTGAAFVAAVKTGDTLPERYRILKTGMGAGKRDYGRTGVLRAMLIEPEEKETDVVWHLESNIDDCTGEALGYVMDRLMEAGARDVYYAPVYMKKNRPAYELNVICKENAIERLEVIIFQNTTTIGIRRARMERTIMSRELQRIDTPLGEAQVKICEIGEERRAYPEYDSVVSLCKEHSLSYQQVWNTVSRAASDIDM